MLNAKVVKNQIGPAERDSGCGQIETASICLSAQFARHGRHGDGGSSPVKVGQTDMLGQAGGQILCKYFIMNDLQDYQGSGRSKPVKVRQTDCEGLIRQRKIKVNQTKSR